MSIKRPDTGIILEGLKDFQRKTVDYVFKRLYGDNPVNRFLIADEVGLGKTLIARGIIAKAIDHLWDNIKRIDIVYICANRDIAAQNIDRLNVTDQQDLALASRLTLLPLHSQTMNEKLNFVSFTPGTSFDLRSKGGIIKERALIYRMLRDGLDIKGAGLKNLLQGDAGIDSWNYWIKRIYDEKENRLNDQLMNLYIEKLKEENIIQRLEELMQRFPRCKENVPPKDRQERNALIGDLRRLLAQCCLDALEPDLIILDEFQRFKNLLEGGDEVSQLAHKLFNYHNAKVILLSATPYKMYTMTHESEQDDHYKDFLRTVEFLFESKEKTVEFKQDLERYRRAIYEVDTKGFENMRAAKEVIEDKLRKVMVRTERLAVTEDRNGMVTDSPLEHCSLKPQDLKSFKMIDRISRLLDVPDPVEYWKSAPYLLNFMDKSAYNIKKRFIEHVIGGKLQEEVVKIFDDARDGLLPWEKIKNYQEIDPQNAKLRELLGNTVEKKAWKLLWIPPSLPYYLSPDSPFEARDLKAFTKALVFSSWQVVPKVIATLCSYEAERCVMETSKTPYEYGEMYEKRYPLIVFSVSEGSLRGMRFFSLIYPCLTLASMIDPMKISFDLATNGSLPQKEEVMDKVKERINELLGPALSYFEQNKLTDYSSEHRTDHSWYFAALALLDKYYCENTVRKWRSHKNNKDDDMDWSSILTSREERNESQFAEHIIRFWEYFDLLHPLGPKPDDLSDILAKIAIASPAVVCLRSFLRLDRRGNIDHHGDTLMASAAKVSMGFRTLFNRPDSIILIRSTGRGEDERYWEEVLDYCVAGNLQSVMDEYVHILRESLGQAERPIESAVPKIAEEIASAVSIKTITLDFDDIRLEEGKVTFQSDSPHTIRCRFALRYGDAKNVEDSEETRADQVRRAFNSPFHPFILASTSVGQEGLDFHHYCHSIYHWNLPANPVDLEQREGRIHRYKGHVIRKNIVLGIPLKDLAEQVEPLDDPWKKLFELASRLREEGMNELVPYWIYDKGGVKIQRFVPCLPLSKDHGHLKLLKQTLAIYRMVFGQPRQEDLVAYLKSRIGNERLRSLEKENLLIIDLQPVTGDNM